MPPLAACGGGSSSGGSGELAVWHELTGSGNAAMEQVISDFNASTTGPKRQSGSQSGAGLEQF